MLHLDILQGLVLEMRCKIMIFNHLNYGIPIQTEERNNSRIDNIIQYQLITQVYIYNTDTILHTNVKKYMIVVAAASLQ